MKGGCVHAGNGQYYRFDFVPGRGVRQIYACFWCALQSAHQFFRRAEKGAAA